MPGERVRFVGKHSRDGALSLYVQQRVVAEAHGAVEPLGVIVRVRRDVAAALPARGLAPGIGVMAYLSAGPGRRPAVLFRAEAPLLAGASSQNGNASSQSGNASSQSGSASSQGGIFDRETRFVAGLPDEWHVPLLVRLPPGCPPAVHLLNAGGGAGAAHAGLTYYVYAYVARQSVFSAPPAAFDMAGRASKVFVAFAKTDAPHAVRLGPPPPEVAANGKSSLLSALDALLLRSAEAPALRARLQRSAYVAGETLTVDVCVEGAPPRGAGLRVTLKQVVHAAGLRLKTTLAAWTGALPGPAARIEVPLTVPLSPPARLAAASVFPRPREHVLAPSARGPLRVQYYVNVHLVRHLAPHTTVRLFFALLPPGTALVAADASAVPRQQPSAAISPHAIVSFSPGDSPDDASEDLAEDPAEDALDGPNENSGTVPDNSPSPSDSDSESSADSVANAGWRVRRAQSPPSTADTLSPGPATAADVDAREAVALCVRLRAMLSKAAQHGDSSGDCAHPADGLERAAQLRVMLGKRRAELSGEMIRAVGETANAPSLSRMGAHLSVVLTCHCVLAPVSALEAGVPLDGRIEAAARVLDDLELAAARLSSPAPCGADDCLGRIRAGVRSLAADVPGYALCADALRLLWAALHLKGLIDGPSTNTSHSTSLSLDEAHCALASLLQEVVSLAEPACTAAPGCLRAYVSALCVVVAETPVSDGLRAAAYWQWHLLAAVVRAHLGADAGVRASPVWAGSVPCVSDRPASVPLLAERVIEAMQQL